MAKFIEHINLKRYFIYIVRWQLSTPLLAPIVSMVKGSSSVFGTREDWIAATIANLIGALFFYWVDQFIFTSRKLASQWEVRDNVRCVDCGKVCRGYRLVASANYDRLHDKKPEFRCEKHSKKKTKQLKKRGVKV